MIGALAVIAILAAMLLPVVVKRLDQAAWTKEMSDLGAIGNALTQQTLQSNTIPDQNGWAAATANWLIQPIANITNNPRHFNRYYLIDPGFTLSGVTLPFVQANNVGLANCPTNTRVLVVSTVGRANLPLTSGTWANFSDIWNTPRYAKPATLAAWPGTGEDICIQRLNFEPLFHQLILVNEDAASPAQFFINNSSLTNVAVGVNPWNQWYLDGTVVSLCTTSGMPAIRYVLKSSASFVFEYGAWLGQPGLGPGPPSSSTNLTWLFSAAAVNFYNAPWNSSTAADGGKGGTQSAVLAALSDFMLTYTMWADASPPFATPGVSDRGNIPIVQSMTIQAGNIDTYSGNGPSGLLWNK
jgi:type II secretory pathway pseudopilin PulG